MSNVIDKNTKKKELRTSNSSIKVYIVHSSILIYLSALISIKPKSMSSPVPFILDPTKHDPQSFPYQTEPKEEEYLASSSSDNQFANNVKSNNKDNNAIATIERLFLNNRHRSSYERLTEKAVYKTCKFFIYSAKYISSKDQVALCGIRLELRPFQALGIFSMLHIEMDTSSRGILANKWDMKKRDI